MRGAEIIVPSGKFWTDIPIDRVRASEGGMTPLSAPEKATPTAIPSGILWSVTAINSIRLSPSFGVCVSSVLISGTRKSSSIIPAVPLRKPATAGIHEPAASIAGISSDHTEAAVITPAAKPSIARWKRGFAPFFIKNTAAAPIEVPMNGNTIPTTVSVMQFIQSPISKIFLISEIFRFQINVRQ